MIYSNRKCDYCGKTKKWTARVTEGCYCIECLRLKRYELLEGINEIRKQTQRDGKED